MPQLFIEMKKLVYEVLHILLVVLRDNCGVSLEISENLANLLVNRLVEPARYVAKLASAHVFNSS